MAMRRDARTRTAEGLTNDRWPLILAVLAMMATGCAEPDEGPAWNLPHVTGLAADVDDDLSTTLRVRWDVLWIDPADVSDPYVTFDDGDGHAGEVEAALQGDGSFGAVLYALRPDQDYEVRVGGDAPSGPFTSAEHSFATGPLPSFLPHVDFVGEPREAGYLVTSLLADEAFPAILNAHGEFVWWHEPEDRDVTVLRAALSRDGRSVIYLAESCGFEPDVPCSSTLRTVRLDGSAETELVIPSAHHDFVELADGTVAVLAREFHDLEGVPWAVDSIVLATPDGETFTTWSSWDMLALDPEAELSETGVVDATHANALDHVESMDAFVVSMRHLSSLVAVDRPSGEVLWKLGGEHSDYTLQSGAEASWFVNQHQFEFTGQRVVLFDNGPDGSWASRVVEYDLGPAASAEAAQVWEYISDPGLYCYAMGDVSELGDGHRMVTWATAGIVEEVTPGHEVLWQMRFDLGQGVGYSIWVDELY
jgi:hypothetical protein